MQAALFTYSKYITNTCWKLQCLFWHVSFIVHMSLPPLTFLVVRSPKLLNSKTICSSRKLSLVVHLWRNGPTIPCHSLEDLLLLEFPRLYRSNSVFFSIYPSWFEQSCGLTSNLVIFHLSMEIFIDILSFKESFELLFLSLNYKGFITLISPKCECNYFFFIYHLPQKNNHIAIYSLSNHWKNIQQGEIRDSHEES